MYINVKRTRILDILNGTVSELNASVESFLCGENANLVVSLYVLFLYLYVVASYLAF